MAQAAAGTNAGTAGALGHRYARRRPERSLLYKLVETHYPTCISGAASARAAVHDTTVHVACNVCHRLERCDEGGLVGCEYDGSATSDSLAWIEELVVFLPEHTVLGAFDP